MAVIAMTQEMATLGKDVALGVCEALGLGEFDQNRRWPRSGRPGLAY